MKKLAIITTHPIQYYAPVFKLLHERKHVEIKVFYSWGEKSNNKHDPGFGKVVKWDLPLLEDYPFEWISNTARNPGSHHFSGIKNPDLIHRITQWKPDSVLVFGWAYQSHLQVIRHFKGKLPVYFRGDSTMLDETKGFKPLIKKWFLTWVYKHIDRTFYVGTENKRYFKSYGLKEDQLIFTPHAVDNNRYAEDHISEAMNLRKNLKINSNDILILFAGKFESKKDPGLLLNAFSRMDNKNVHLLFAGNGPLEGSLKSQISDLNSHNVHFMDFQNQTKMPALYQACDIFCLPSKGPGESWGLAINEAMSCSRAILTSDKVGSAYDLVEQGRNGSIFKSGNLTDLKEKLEHLTSSRRKLEEYGKCSKEIIKSWNFETIASAIETTLKNEPQR